MRPIINGKDQHITVGLDIGSSNIKCAIGEIIYNEKKVKLLGVASVKSNGIRKGTIINRDQLIQQLEIALNEAELMANIKVSNIILSLTGEHIRSLNTQAAIALNRANGTPGSVNERSILEDDIYQVLDQAQAVSLPVDRDILHTLPQEYLVDTLEKINNPIGMTGRRLEAHVHLVTAATTAMNNLVSCVEELGITVDGLVFQPLASAIATLNKDEMDLGVTLVEIGASTTNISVYNNQSVRHSGIIPIGASIITNDIAVMLQIGIEEAEKIKIKYASSLSTLSSPKLEIKLSSSSGKAERSITEQEVSKYVEARMQEIFQMIIREISRADIKDPLTYGIVLTGGGSQMRNIIPLAEKSIGVQVRQGIPKNIDGIQNFANSSDYSTVMGLLLWPLYSTDHVRSKHNNSNNFMHMIKNIKHTIENLF